MSFHFRRVSHFRSFPFSSKHGVRHQGSVTSKHFLSSTSKSSEGKEFNHHLVPPVYTQTPPPWVRYAWAIIIANGLMMGSAIEITWNHWATLVKDLEEIGEKHRATIAVAESTEDTQQETKNQHWEQRPTWQRAVFCGVYAAGWALSSTWLLKYKQTFTTSIRFFRAKRLSFTQSQSPSPTSIPTMTSFQRFIHISTASNPSGIPIALSELTIQDGRNETELVIRYPSHAGSSGSRPERRKRDYWYVSLTGARVQGSKFGDVESARNNVIRAWDGKIGNGGPILTPDGIIEEKNARVKGKKEWKEKR